MNYFLGQLLLVPFGFAPRYWALCNGQLLPISQNQALFSLLGTTFGGDGRTTFGLPDLRGKTANSSGQGPGLQPYTLGQTNGVEAVTLLISQLPNHQHALRATAAAANSNVMTGELLGDAGSLNIYTNGVATPNAAMAAATVGNAGGNQPHPNQSPYLVMNWIIALSGIFPSRD